MGWIDSLKGKFSRLKVNQIVAVSSSRFSDSAKTKAAGRLIGSVCRGVGRAGDLAHRIEQAFGLAVDTGHHVMLPGMKQRMAIVSFSPSQTCIGHTMVRPSRFGSLMIASSGTSYQLPSMRTL
jgi:hypothetical protein